MNKTKHNTHADTVNECRSRITVLKRKSKSTAKDIIDSFDQTLSSNDSELLPANRHNQVAIGKERRFEWAKSLVYSCAAKSGVLGGNPSLLIPQVILNLGAATLLTMLNEDASLSQAFLQICRANDDGRDVIDACQSAVDYIGWMVAFILVNDECVTHESIANA